MDTIVATVVAAAGAVAGYGGQRTLDLVVDSFASAIIRPCAERRAHAYFRKLAEEVAGTDVTDDQPELIAAALDAVTKKETARETVFEFYRHSVLSRSREIGPRLLALIAARLINADRKPTVAEQEVAEIAEACTDEDFSEFAAYYQSLRKGSTPKHSERVRVVPAGYLVLLNYNGSDSSDSSSTVGAGPLNLSTELGRWAAKMEHVGAVQQLIETAAERHGIIFDERGDTEAGTRYRTEWSVFFGETCQELARLLPLATR